MAVLGLCFCARAFSSWGKWGPLFIAVRGPLTITVSLVAEHRLQTRRLSSCGSRAQLLRGMWDLPRQGLEPVSPALAGRLSTTAPPGKPPQFIFKEKAKYFLQLDIVDMTFQQLGFAVLFGLEHLGAWLYRYCWTLSKPLECLQFSVTLTTNTRSKHCFSKFLTTETLLIIRIFVHDIKILLTILSHFQFYFFFIRECQYNVRFFWNLQKLHLAFICQAC